MPTVKWEGHWKGVTGFMKKDMAGIQFPGDLTVAIYLRISDEDKDRKKSAKTESDSIASQRSILLDFIGHMPDLQGADIIEFCDDGWSGKNFERPAVTKMLEQVRQRKIQCIVVKDISRFGRDYLAVGDYLSRVFPFLGVRFIAVNNGFDSIRRADVDSLETSFKTLLYDTYSRELSRKVRQAERFRTRQGEFLSSFAPYGYVKDSEDKKRLLPDPDAAKVVRRIFKMAVEGYGTEQIARILNGEKIPTPMQYKRAHGCSRTAWHSVHEDNFWTRDRVRTILQDERYIGNNIFGKRKRTLVGGYRQVKTDRSEWVVAQGTHEGLVTIREFDYVQNRLHASSRRGCASPGAKEPLLYRKVRCGICGYAMSRGGRKRPYYTCHTSCVTEGYPCGGEKIPEEDILSAVLGSLRMQFLCGVELSSIWEEKCRQEKCALEAASKRIAGLKEALAGAERDMGELYEKLVFGEIDRAGYLKAKDAAAKRCDKIAGQVERLKESQGKAIGQVPSLADKAGRETYIKEIVAKIAPDVLREIVIYPGRRFVIAWDFGEPGHRGGSR